MGREPVGEFFDLGELVQPSRKVVRVWAVRRAFDVAALKSNQVELGWPPKSGRTTSFPEVDRAEWFVLAQARQKILPGQRAFIDRLLARLGSLGRSGP